MSRTCHLALPPAVSGEDYAAMLVSSGVIKVNTTQPFRWKSGMRSPVYFNARDIQGMPALYLQTLAQFHNVLRNFSFNAVAGIQNAAIPLSMGLSILYQLPHASVAKRLKDHGVLALVEGVSPKHLSFALIEDTMSTSSSVAAGLEALPNLGGKVAVVVVIMSHDIAGANEKVRANVPLRTLVSPTVMIRIMHNLHFLTDAQAQLVQNFYDAPQAWSSRHRLE